MEAEALDNAAVDLGINPRESGERMLDFSAIFGNDRPVCLEIGSGKGRFLIQEATARPSVNFVGIEKSLHYYRVIRSRLEKRALTNARIINYDASLVVSRMLPDASIREIHIYFPDPWPRRREQKRRIIRPDVVSELARILEPEGTGCYVTDHREYFEAAAPVLADVFETEAFEVNSGTPRTNYEAKYRREGRPIFEVDFKLKIED